MMKEVEVQLLSLLKVCFARFIRNHFPILTWFFLIVKEGCVGKMVSVSMHSKTIYDNRILKPPGACMHFCSITQEIIRDKFNLLSPKPLLRQILLCIINALQTSSLPLSVVFFLFFWALNVILSCLDSLALLCTAVSWKYSFLELA